MNKTQGITMCKIKRWRSAVFQPPAPLQFQCVCGLERRPKTAPNLTRSRYKLC